MMSSTPATTPRSVVIWLKPYMPNEGRPARIRYTPNRNSPQFVTLIDAPPSSVCGCGPVDLPSPSHRVAVAPGIGAAHHPPILAEYDPLAPADPHRPVLEDLEAVSAGCERLPDPWRETPFQQQDPRRERIAHIVHPPEPGGGDRILDVPAKVDQVDDHLGGRLRDPIGPRGADHERQPPAAGRMRGAEGIDPIGVRGGDRSLVDSETVHR